MGDQVKVGYYIPRAAQARLRGLAERDHRSLSGEIAWLIEQEWQCYVARLRARREEAREAGTGAQDGEA